jgi:hypothetical protein
MQLLWEAGSQTARQVQIHKRELLLYWYCITTARGPLPLGSGGSAGLSVVSWTNVLRMAQYPYATHDSHPIATLASTSGCAC